jgi:hypothetical protein
MVGSNTGKTEEIKISSGRALYPMGYRDILQPSTATQPSNSHALMQELKVTRLSTRISSASPADSSWHTLFQHNVSQME